MSVGEEYKNGYMRTCATCGYEWEHGRNGQHSCITVLRARVADLERENTELKVFGDKLIGQSAEIAQRAAYERCIQIIINESVSIPPTYIINAIRAEMEKGGEYE